jgi:hypothetical protein
MNRKTGTVYSSNPKGWIFIYVTPQERYFLHISELRSDRLPELGDQISFIPAPPRKSGQLPCAIDAKPVTVAVAAESSMTGVV